MIITFSGLDGSGKTTLAEAVIGHLRKKGHRVRYLHTIKDSFYYFLLHRGIGKVSKASKESLEKGLRQKDNKLRFLFLMSVKRLFLLLQVFYFALRYGNKKGNKKNHVICDRYFYDDIVQLAYLASKNEMSRSFFQAILIKPDLSFLLEVDPQEAYKRKQEYEEDYFDKKATLYREIFKSFTAVIVPPGALDATLQYILREVERCVLM